MFERSHIEKLLKVNGVVPPASDETIKSVLLSAQWHEDDVEAAIFVLKENNENHETHVDAIHKVFRSDDRLSPDVISSMLGLEFTVPATDVTLRRRRARGAMSASQMMTVAVSSLILSLIFVFAAMWYLEMGLFHQTVRFR